MHRHRLPILLGAYVVLVAVSLFDPRAALPSFLTGAGLAVPPENAEALAAAVITLARDPGLRARMGAHARDYAVEHYSRRTLTGAFIREVERVARTPRKEAMA